MTEDTSTQAMTGRERLYSSLVHFSEAFVICAGSVLLRKDPQRKEWQICILHSPKAEVYVLPKGRKDCGESIEVTATRETFEETGYDCKLLPCTMTTRAPLPHVNMVDAPHVVEGATEPFAFTVRNLGEKGTKIIWWYLTIATGEVKRQGTQTNSEDFHSEFVEAGKALKKLTFQDDQEVVRKALKLVRDLRAGGGQS
ncbi:hypothetical protein PAXRUDRAFT_823967 [Paxillus rubicundulus Ve08.2h10]|uniref:Unplaced genomic scaffold scaffold_75, whole genome shotgun sequence n=1 Tax=Paxillus rubicundulus Ve08.2h10 TaxID=930991 RepID=A0A0D0DUX3_9AGAM|nr:hypothetical protein PAXRUDRAFT_823967 [Paxillus rubicundulus Ve08.2h10]